MLGAKLTTAGLAFAALLVLVLTPLQASSQKPTLGQHGDLSQWGVYRDVRHGFEFRYPETLTLSTEGSRVVLSHSISYGNLGDCDLQSDGRTRKLLIDFRVSFEPSEKPVRPTHVDGEYAAGLLKGPWVYEGAEGCGQIAYYFTVGEKTALTVRRDAVQALSGLTTSWNLAEILKVPGVISKEESEALFSAILSTVKLLR